MEGIRDGQARDSCYECGLLHPELADGCPRCENRMRFEPARQLDALELEQRIRAGIDAYLTTRAPTELDALLETLHRFCPESLEELERDARLSLADLRAAHAELTARRPR